MRKLFYLLTLGTLIFTACNSDIETIQNTQEPVLIKVNLLQDTTIARINEYTLTSSDPDKDSIESRKIIDLKLNLINAIENQDSAFLVSKLHPTFSFVSGQSFYSRKDFIDQRLYEGIDLSNFKLIRPTLQILDQTAVLSYVQIDKIESEESRSFWTDIYKYVNGEWKLATIRRL